MKNSYPNRKFTKL